MIMAGNEILNIDAELANNLAGAFTEVSNSFSNSLSLGATDNASTITANGKIDVMLGYANRNRSEFSSNMMVDKQLWDSWLDNMLTFDRELVKK